MHARDLLFLLVLSSLQIPHLHAFHHARANDSSKLPRRERSHVSNPARAGRSAHLGGMHPTANNADANAALLNNLVARNNVSMSEVERLLRKGVSINFAEESDVTALMWATINGNIDVATLLLEHGANPLVEDEDGINSIMCAALLGRTALLEKLVELGRVDVNTLNPKSGKSALTYAINLGHTEIIETLIRLGANPNQVVEGEPALTQWLRKASENVELARSNVTAMLLRAGAGVNLVNLRGETPLLVWLIEAGTSEKKSAVTATLLLAGADVNFAGEWGTDDSIIALAARYTDNLGVFVEMGPLAESSCALAAVAILAHRAQRVVNHLARIRQRNPRKAPGEHPLREEGRKIVWHCEAIATLALLNSDEEFDCGLLIDSLEDSLNEKGDPHAKISFLNLIQASADAYLQTKFGADRANLGITGYTMRRTVRPAASGSEGVKAEHLPASMLGENNATKRAYGGSGDLPELAMASVAYFSGGSVPTALLARWKQLRTCIGSKVDSIAAGSSTAPALASTEDALPEPLSTDWVYRTTLPGAEENNETQA